MFLTYKVKGAYAALLTDTCSAQRTRLSNDANIACMDAFTTGSKVREELAIMLDMDIDEMKDIIRLTGSM